MKIAILSNGNANYSTKRLVEVAKARGHEVRVVKYKNAYASIEQNHPVLRYRGKDLSGFDAIIPRIASNMTRYGAGNDTSNSPNSLALIQKQPLNKWHWRRKSSATLPTRRKPRLR